jgi:hypothetical protein
MNITSPAPTDARASLDEAQSRAAAIRRADRQFRPILLVLAATYLVIAVLLSINPRGGNLLIGDSVVVAYVAGVGGTFYLAWRIRVWSRVGTLWLALAAFAFVIWNGAVVGVSIATGWWGPHQPGIHFGGSALVAVLPLLAAAWLIGRR